MKHHVLLEATPKGPQPIVFIPHEGEDRTPEDRQPFQFTMSTIDRPGQYAHSTLASMYMGGFPSHYRLNLMVGSQDTEYLQNYRHHSHVVVEPMTAEDMSIISSWHVKARSAFNYWRCLSKGGSSAIFEDDVRFQNYWLGKLLRVVQDIQKDGHDEYVLTLFSVRPYTSKKSYFVYPAVQYDCGTVSMFYPATVVRRIAQHILERVVYDPLNPSQMTYDLLIKEWCIQNGVPMFATTESLVQHVGKKTVMGNQYDTSPLFREATNEAAGVYHCHGAIGDIANSLKETGADSLLNEVQNEV